MAHALAGTAILRGVFLILVSLYPGPNLGVGTPHQVDEVDVRWEEKDIAEKWGSIVPHLQASPFSTGYR